MLLAVESSLSTPLCLTLEFIKAESLTGPETQRQGPSLTLRFIERGSLPGPEAQRQGLSLSRELTDRLQWLQATSIFKM